MLYSIVHLKKSSTQALNHFHHLALGFNGIKSDNFKVTCGIKYTNIERAFFDLREGKKAGRKATQ